MSDFGIFQVKTMGYFTYYQDLYLTLGGSFHSCRGQPGMGVRISHLLQLKRLFLWNCKEIFFNTNKFLKFMKSFQNTPRPLHQCCLLLFADYERLWSWSCIACVKEGGFSWPMIFTLAQSMEWPAPLGSLDTADLRSQTCPEFRCSLIA